MLSRIRVTIGEIGSSGRTFESDTMNNAVRDEITDDKLVVSKGKDVVLVEE